MDRNQAVALLTDVEIGAALVGRRAKLLDEVQRIDEALEAMKHGDKPRRGGRPRKAQSGTAEKTETPRPSLKADIQFVLNGKRGEALAVDEIVAGLAQTFGERYGEKNLEDLKKSVGVALSSYKSLFENMGLGNGYRLRA